ncbi:molybdopterin cofactor-binding domain-containing protein [Ramlibacter sp.]|uniref:xanthine dehydrogenase family protein molybdopterin-binding subunit n=1 Tax=Ramlibacter sp. TaxID=1917967 RepID=UPI003D0D5680
MNLELTRRGFLTLTGGLVIGFVLPPSRAQAQGGLFAPPPANKPNAYIRIGTDDSVTFLIPKSEMGQGPTTACSQMLAEELECDWSKVRMQVAPVDPDLYGHQTTVGSMAIRTSWDPLRQAGAQAREMLILAAAQQWGVSAAGLRAENGFVINPATNQRINYGAIAEAASRLSVPASVTLKDPSQFRIIGRPQKRLDTRDKVTARAMFGIDARPAGLVYAAVERCPVFGGTVARFDASRARAVAGVRDVFQISSGVAVVADNTWAAMQGKRALTVEWNEGPNAAVSSESIRQMFVTNAASPGAVARNDGDAAAAIARAARKVEATYEVPFTSHAPMEPMNATVHVKADGTAEAWVPTQSPTTSRARIAEIANLAPEKVDVHTTFMGGGFGRRGEGQINHLEDATEIALRLRNTPVKLTWTREDDMTQDYYRPASYAQLAGALDAAGWPAALRATIACPSFFVVRDGLDPIAVGGMSDLRYELPDLRVEWSRSDTHIPVSFWRAPGAAQNTYFAESFFDELCAAGGKDPVEARRRLLAGAPRLLNVLNVAAERAGWGTPLPAGRGRGVALGSNVGSFNAQIAEVSVENGRVRVHEVVCALDCGQIINPHILRQQVEGGIIYGLSATLKGQITIERGRVKENNFNTHDMLRFDEAPVVEVHLVESRERPTGAGEATNPATVPAVINAIYAATGKRIRTLPVKPTDLA